MVRPVVDSGAGNLTIRSIFVNVVDGHAPAMDTRPIFLTGVTG